MKRSTFAHARWSDLALIFLGTFVLVVIGHALQGRALVTDVTVVGFALAAVVLFAALAVAKRREARR